MNKADKDALLDELCVLAKQAGAIIEDVRDDARQNPTEKDHDQGPVTEADLRANAFLRDALAERFPDDLLVTEEDWDLSTEVPRHPSTWYVDPLDGTKDFIRGGPDYSVMIGHATAGVPDVGVVHQPQTGITWAAHVPSRTVYRLDDQGRHDLSAPAKGPETLRIATSRSHPSKAATALAEKLNATAIVKGSVGLKIGLILDGEADLYLSGTTRIKVWDTCGPAALLHAFGGQMTALDGSPLRFFGSAAHKRGIRAGSPAALADHGGRVQAMIDAFLAQRPFS